MSYSSCSRFKSDRVSLRITDAAASFLNFIHDYVAEKAYSRKLEMEADAVGLGFMSMAGYNPHSMLDLWDVMALVECVHHHPVPEICPLTRSLPFREDAAASGTPITITDRVQFLKTHPTSLQRQKVCSYTMTSALQVLRLFLLQNIDSLLPKAMKMYERSPFRHCPTPPKAQPTPPSS